MAKTAVIIGPMDHGRRMGLEEFDQADTVEGYLYELSRGTIIASDIPDDEHFAQVDSIKQQLYSYRATRLLPGFELDLAAVLAAAREAAD